MNAWGHGAQCVWLQVPLSCGGHSVREGHALLSMRAVRLCVVMLAGEWHALIACEAAKRSGSG